MSILVKKFFWCRGVVGEKKINSKNAIPQERSTQLVKKFISACSPGQVKSNGGIGLVICKKLRLYEVFKVRGNGGLAIPQSCLDDISGTSYSIFKKKDMRL